MADLIDRQAAIDALKRISFSYYFECGEYLSEDTREIEIINSNKALEAIKALPSAQSEIIRCRDCKNWDKTWTNDWSPEYHYCPMIDGVRKGDFYCAHAERKGEPMSDLISRQAAIKAIEDLQDCYNGFSDTYDKACIIGVLEEVPSAQSEYRLDEWCTDCKEYDHERHCCPRFNHVIRATLQEVQAEQSKIIRCKDCLMHGVCRFEQGLGLDGYCSQAERRAE